jgi:hypothetical protein
MESRDDEPAALLFGERDVRLGQSGGFDLATHQQIEPVGRAVRHAAELDLVARNEALQHLQRQVMRSEEERHADLPVGELLRGLNRRICPHDKRREGHDRTAADLAAADPGVADAGIVAPLAGVI